MPEIIDGQSATLTVGGQTVGGITQYQFFQGTPAVARVPTINAPARIYKPTQPDYGTATLTLYRNHADPGQQQMAASQAESSVKPCVLALEDGTTRNFDAFCESIPLIGGKQLGQTINTSTARIRITGPVT